MVDRRKARVPYIVLLSGCFNGACDRLENLAQGLMADFFGAGINGWWHPRGVEGIETCCKHPAAHLPWFRRFQSA